MKKGGKKERREGGREGGKEGGNETEQRVTHNLHLDLTCYTTHSTVDIVSKVQAPTLLLVQLANSPLSADTGQLQHSQFNRRAVQNLEKTQTLRTVQED